MELGFLREQQGYAAFRAGVGSKVGGVAESKHEGRQPPQPEGEGQTNNEAKEQQS